MPFKLIAILFLIVYIFSGYMYDSTDTSNSYQTINFQKEIYIDENDTQVFKRKSVDDISVIEKKVEVWLIEIKYDDNSLDSIRKKLISNGYKLQNNKTKRVISVGPFTAKSHAKEESNKLNKILGIDNKISNYIF